MLSKLLFAVLAFSFCVTSTVVAKGLDDFVTECLDKNLSENDEHLMRVLANYVGVVRGVENKNKFYLYYPFDYSVWVKGVLIEGGRDRLARDRDFSIRVNGFDQEDPVYDQSGAYNSAALQIREKEEYDYEKSRVVRLEQVLIEERASLAELQEAMTQRTAEFCAETFGNIFRRSDLDLSLRFVGRKLNSLRLMSHFRKLKSFRAQNNVIRDISALNSLDSLHALDVSRNLLSNLAFFASTSVESLDVSKNVLTELSVGGLPKLRVLDASSNGIEDISHLDSERVPELTELRLADNSIRETDGFAAFIGLRVLDLRSNSLTELGDLKALASLQVIDLADNARLDKLHPALLPDSLEEIRLGGTKIDTLPWPWENTGNGVFKKVGKATSAVSQKRHR